MLEFQEDLMENILSLHKSLKDETYKHSTYYAFKISDPKPRDIHKATVQDRLVHHAIYRVLYPFFDKKFIADSYSCRENKGTHKALNRFRVFAYKVSKNNTRTCWILKCDIRKFFASIDHVVLLQILARQNIDPKTLILIKKIVSSFSSTAPNKGLPLGNLTSQLLVNIYMNEFDQFAKHTLKAKRYIRYADDFVIVSENKRWLENLIPKISGFLVEKLKLELHPNKLYLRTLSSGLDFLGWVNFPNHRILRTSSKKRMIRNLSGDRNEARIQSYRGLLSHGNTQKLCTRYLQ